MACSLKAVGDVDSQRPGLHSVSFAYYLNFIIMSALLCNCLTFVNRFSAKIKYFHVLRREIQVGNLLKTNKLKSPKP